MCKCIESLFAVLRVAEQYLMAYRFLKVKKYRKSISHIFGIMGNLIMSNSKKYYFEEVKNCEMCGDESQGHIVLGQRLNQSQGFSPKKKTGITVSVMKCKKCGLIYAQPLPIPFDIQDHYGCHTKVE